MTTVVTCSRRRIGRPRHLRPRLRPHVERGAAAVEAVLVSALVLVPLFLGILNYGQLFWDEQKTALYPPRLNQSIASGYCTTEQIVERVKSAAADSIYALNRQTLADLPNPRLGGKRGFSRDDVLSYLEVTVRHGVSLGADVTVSLKLPTQQVGNIVPLPGNQDGFLVRDVNQRLDYVQVSTTGTQCSPT